MDDRPPFAIADGFDSPRSMIAFWIKNHGSGLFDGALIKLEPQD